MNRAVFLDRDGVINHPHGKYYVHRIEDFDINKGIPEGLRALADRGFLLVIITNQGGISKGEYTREDVKRLHAYLEQQLALHDITISSIEYCPHHDSIERCLCRKPQPLMIQKAMARLGIEAERSYFIGDKPSDMEAGAAAGLKTILIRENQDIREVLDRIN